MSETWPNILNFAFEQPHESKFKKLVALGLRGILKPLLFNLEFRISFFSGIGATSKIGTIGEFLQNQTRIHTEMKSTHKPFFQKITQKSLTRKLYTVLQPYFPPAEVSIFSAGEATSNMSKACDVAVTYLLLTEQLKKQVKAFAAKLVIYLIIFTVFIVVFARIISESTKPIQKQLGGALPESTQFFIDMDVFLTNNLIYLAIILVSLFILTTYRLPRGKGKFRSFLHTYIPGFKLYRRYVSCSFLLSLSAMLGSGMTMQEAIRIINSTSLDYLGYHTDSMRRKLAASASKSKALNVDLLPKMMYLNVTQFISGKDVGDALMAVAEFELKSLERTLGRYNVILRMIIFGVAGYLIITGYSASFDPALELMEKSYQY